MSPSSIKNAIVKTELMTLETDQEAMNEMKNLVREVTQTIVTLNFLVGQEEV